MLLYVLAVVLMLSITALAAARAAISSGKVSSGLQVSTRTLHTIDGAFEKSVNEFRNDAAMVGVGCDGITSGPYDDPDSDENILVTCDNAAGISPTAIQRTMDLTATREPSGSLVGLARIKVVDEIHGQQVPGYSVEVCDWLLGGAAVDQTLRGCAS